LNGAGPRVSEEGYGEVWFSPASLVFLRERNEHLSRSAGFTILTGDKKGVELKI
jgi:hypothetical protein